MPAGVHINALGADTIGKTELDPHLLTLSKIIVEYLPQTSIEGEVQNVPLHHVDAEMWEVASNIVKGREHPEEITIFDGVGFAIEDYSALCCFYALSQKHQIGTLLPMTPKAQNPKDLFGILID